MAYATTDAAVRALLDNPDPNADYTFALDTAYNIVTENCTDSGQSDTTLELIVRWLAAHFVEVRRARLRRDAVKTAEGEIISQSDLGFDVTHYGQQAMRIDKSKALARLNNSAKTEGKTQPIIEKRSVGLQWLGRRKCP